MSYNMIFVKNVHGLYVKKINTCDKRKQLIYDFTICNFANKMIEFGYLFAYSHINNLWATIDINVKQKSNKKIFWKLRWKQKVC